MDTVLLSALAFARTWGKPACHIEGPCLIVLSRGHRHSMHGVQVQKAHTQRDVHLQKGGCPQGGREWGFETVL